MEELTPEEQLEQQKTAIREEIERLTESKVFPEKARALINTPEWKEVIEEIYIDSFAKDLVRNFDEYDEARQLQLDEEFKIRSRFLNTIQAWAEGADKAELQIARYQEMIDNAELPQASKEPTIDTK